MINLICFSYWASIYSILYFAFCFNCETTIMLSAFIHATLTTTLSTIILSTIGYDYFRSNSIIEITTIKLSLFYFVFDLMFLLLVNRDFIYIIHHVITIIVFNELLKMGNSCSVGILMLFLGEITNPIRIAKQMAYLYNRRLYKPLRSAFYWLFLIFRVPIMTYFAFEIYFNFIVYLEFNKKITIFPCLLIGLFGGYYWAFLMIKKNLKSLKISTSMITNIKLRITRWFT